MKKWQEVSDLIEQKLSYTNGWKIPDEHYKKLCDEVAIEILKPKPVYKKKTMKTLIEKIRQGEDYFGSGGHTTPNFNSFFLQFKKELNKKLVNIDGFHSLEVGKGHFYISGFFTIKGQPYYFSINDVRWNTRNPEQMLVRTAKHYKDFTGGQNNYVSLDTLDTDIIKTFRL